MTASILKGIVAALLPFAAIEGAEAADPSALWRIVHGSCVPNEVQHHDPAPCELVDLSRGEERGYAVLKDLVGATQFLVIPTGRVPGIESPALLATDAPNYMQDAWGARRFVEAKARGTLAREDLSLAINSTHGRTQDQFHIHVDCVRADVHDALVRHRDKLGDAWALFPERLSGHAYIARRLLTLDLASANPFLLLAQGVPTARMHMGDYTLFVAGGTFEGKPGFTLLVDRADPANGNFGHSESLQDHGCALAHS